MVKYQRIFCIAMSLAFLYGSERSLGQDGTLIESSTVLWKESYLEELSRDDPELHTFVSAVNVESMTYRSDGLRVKGFVVRPKHQEHPLPAVIWNRGGNREFGALTDEIAAYFLARIASWGYVVVASQYRGVSGGEGMEEFGGRDVHDVLNLIPLLEQDPSVDSSRIGMIGWSRGGLMTCLALKRTHRIRAAVIGSGVFDSRWITESRPEMETEVYSQLIPDYYSKKDEALASRSPVLWAEEISKSTPLLILHGASDSKVDPQGAVGMAASLLKCQHPFRLVLFEKAEHSLREHEVEVNRLTQLWLSQHLDTELSIE